MKKIIDYILIEVPYINGNGEDKIKKLIKEGIKTHKCENCGITEWMGTKVSIELHHIDGNRENNDISNLKILCPNCHSLQPTHRGRNKNKIK